jgi:hypothetical protein
MTKTVYVTGNDGAGKSTYASLYVAHASKSGLRAVKRHYYSNIVRSFLRSIIVRAVSISERKLSIGDVKVSKGRPKSSLRRKRTDLKMFGRDIIILSLGLYQILIAAEMWLRQLVSRQDLLLIDRSYVDDLASISETLNLGIPERIIRWSALVFPGRKIIYLSAGHELEYSRIVEIDLSAEVHRSKGLHYEAIIDLVERAGVDVQRLNTSFPHDVSLEQFCDWK